MKNWLKFKLNLTNKMNEIMYMFLTKYTLDENDWEITHRFQVSNFDFWVNKKKLLSSGHRESNT